MVKLYKKNGMSNKNNVITTVDAVLTNQDQWLDEEKEYFKGELYKMYY